MAELHIDVASGSIHSVFGKEIDKWAALTFCFSSEADQAFSLSLSLQRRLRSLDELQSAGDRILRFLSAQLKFEQLTDLIGWVLIRLLLKWCLLGCVYKLISLSHLPSNWIGWCYRVDTTSTWWSRPSDSTASWNYSNERLRRTLADWPNVAYRRWGP